MASFVCLFNSPRASSSLSLSLPWSPWTTDVRGASHFTNGVTESRRLPAYSLSHIIIPASSMPVIVEDLEGSTKENLLDVSLNLTLY